MNAEKNSTETEQVFLRHIVAAKHKDVIHIESLVKAPFPDDCASSCDGGSKDVNIPGFASGRCLIAARFAKQSWAALYSNAASAEELFKANAAGRRLEVAWVGCRPQTGWFFKLNRGGKPVVDFAQPIDAERPSTCKLNGVEPDILQRGESGEQAVARLCKHFEINRSLPEIRMRGDGYQVLDANGRPMKSGLRGYVRIDGPELAEGENAASDALAEAIESCDAEGIREAVAQGASLSVLPDSSSSPLTAALFQFDEPDWKECVETLLELGCPVNGAEGEPPLVECVAHYIDEPDALRAARLLVAHGADVNAVNREGTTALFECVTNGNLELVRFLLQHGADPSIKDRNGASALDWLQKRHDEETGFRRRTKYAELLSLLTGQSVAKPEAEPLSPELQAENERFKLCLTARKILAFMPTKFELGRKKASRFAREPWHKDWQQQLLDAGFQPAGQYELGFSSLSAFTHADLGFDAVISANMLGGSPKCDITAYHPDRTTTEVANVPNATPPEFATPSQTRRGFPGATPAQLVEHLQNLLPRKPLLKIGAPSFKTRHLEALTRLAIEGRQRAEQLLNTPSILVGGVPPRFERLRFCFDFSSFDDPAHSTQKATQYWLDSFAQASGDSNARASNAIDAALELAGMSHFQFAGALADPGEYVVRGSELALVHFQSLASAGKGCVEKAPWFQFRALLSGLVLCALAGRWPTVKQICNAVRPKLASANTAGEEDLDFAPALLFFVSSYRDRALPKISDLEEGVRKRRLQRPRLLFDVCSAIGTGREADFDSALRISLEHFLELQGDGFVDSRAGRVWTNDLFRFAALPESLFYQAALNRGMKPPPLPERLADFLLTPESIVMGEVNRPPVNAKPSRT